MYEPKSVLGRFENQLALAVQGSVQAYIDLTERLPEGERVAAWQKYNQVFEERVIVQVLEVLERNGCSVPEVCHAALKLMDVGACLFETAKPACVPTDEGKSPVLPLPVGKRPKKKGAWKKRA
jgi:hypothetical protein